MKGVGLTDPPVEALKKELKKGFAFCYRRVTMPFQGGCAPKLSANFSLNYELRIYPE